MAFHWWAWWQELAQGRPAGFGWSPLSWSEILAWSQITGRTVAPHDVAALRAIDTAYRQVKESQ